MPELTPIQSPVRAGLLAGKSVSALTCASEPRKQSSEIPAALAVRDLSAVALRSSVPLIELQPHPRENPVRQAADFATGHYG
jgi:hypothetical protein